MRKNKLRAQCPRCGHQQFFVRAEINHPLHLALSVLTLGLWLISWLALWLGTFMRPWRCEHCGWHNPNFSRNPESAGPSKPFSIPLLRPMLRPMARIHAAATAQAVTVEKV
jgi:rubredoxin